MKKLTVAALVLGTVMTASAQAGQDEQIAVRYKTADLSSESGRATLYRKLEGAAESICGPTSLSRARSLVRKLENEACVEDTVADLVEQIRDQRLTSFHQKRTDQRIG